LLQGETLIHRLFMLICARRRRHGGNSQARGNSVFGCCRLQPSCCRGRGSYPCATQGAAQRFDRSDYRRAQWPHRQAHRRRAIVEFRSVVDAVRCAIEVQNTMVERNAGVPCGRRQGDWGSTSDCFHPMRPQASFDHTSGSERPRDLAQRRPWARNGHFITEWSKVLGTRRLTGSMTKNSSAFEVEEFNQLLDLKKSFSTFNRASVSL
jgi:hypothetical protein